MRLAGQRPRAGSRVAKIITSGTHDAPRLLLSIVLFPTFDPAGEDQLGGRGDGEARCVGATQEAHRPALRPVEFNHLTGLQADAYACR